MNKTLLSAAAFLTLVMGTAAFAGDGDVNTPAPSTDKMMVAEQTTPAKSSVFPASSKESTSVYPLFSHAGTTQGGEN